MLDLADMSKFHITATLVTVDQQTIYYINIMSKLYKIIPLPTLLFECQSWTLIKQHERTVMVD